MAEKNLGTVRTDPHYLPPQIKGEPFDVTIWVEDGDRNRYEIEIEMEEYAGTIYGVDSLKYSKLGILRGHVVCKTRSLLSLNKRTNPAVTLRFKPDKNGSATLRIFSTDRAFMESRVSTRTGDGFGPLSRNMGDGGGITGIFGERAEEQPAGVSDLGSRVLIGGAMALSLAGALVALLILTPWTSALDREPVASAYVDTQQHDAAPPEIDPVDPSPTTSPPTDSTSTDTEDELLDEPIAASSPPAEESSLDTAPMADPLPDPSTCIPFRSEHGSMVSADGRLVLSCQGTTYTTALVARNARGEVVYQDLTPHDP